MYCLLTIATALIFTGLLIFPDFAEKLIGILSLVTLGGLMLFFMHKVAEGK